MKFRERLEERILAWDGGHDLLNEAQLDAAARFGAREALRIAAEEIKTDMDPYVPQFVNWLRSRAAELEK